jgi:hypothetical protein
MCPASSDWRLIPFGDFEGCQKCNFFIERHGLLAMSAFNDETSNGQDPAVLDRCRLRAHKVG